VELELEEEEEEEEGDRVAKVVELVERLLALADEDRGREKPCRLQPQLEFQSSCVLLMGSL